MSKNMKYLPPEMRDWYFLFNWNLQCLWSLDVPIEKHELAELRWHFDIPIWSRSPGMHFDLCPATVLKNPGLFPRHDRRIEEADIAYPIDMMYTRDRYAIIDGVHRLAKYEKLKISTVAVRIIPREMIPNFNED